MIVGPQSGAVDALLVHGSSSPLAHSAMRMALITIAGFALALFGLCEVGMAYPVAWWLYLTVTVMFAATLIRPVALRSQVAVLVCSPPVVAFVTVLFLVDWTTRKPFSYLRDLARVRVGMTEAEVRRIMGRYMEGTGWPASPFDTPTNTGTLSILGSSSQYATTTSPDGHMVIRDSLVFRHSLDGAFNFRLGHCFIFERQGLSASSSARD